MAVSFEVVFAGEVAWRMGKGDNACDDQDSRRACSQVQPRLKRWKHLA